MKMQQKISHDIKQVNQITAKVIRDLIWLIYTPNIIDFNSPKDFQFKEQNQLHTLIDFGGKLNEQLPTDEVSDSIRLGKYAEQLLQTYFSIHNDYSLLAYNHQLIEGKTTIGELDYLIHDFTDNSFLHLEFAIKYYLKVKIEGEIKYLGPSTKDWLARKKNNMLLKQSQLAFTHKHLFPEALRRYTFTPKVAIKGCLFLPYQEWQQVNTNCLNRGWWILFSAIDMLQNAEHRFYLITERINWIFPFDNRQDSVSFDQLKVQSEALLSNQNEVMIVRLDASNTTIDRGFIVRSNWPN